MRSDGLFTKGHVPHNKLYGKDHIEWLRKNYQDSRESVEVLVQRFNKEFGTSIATSGIKRLASLNGIKKKQPYKKYEFETEWITKNYEKYAAYDEMYKALVNEIPNTKMTRRILTDYCCKKGITKSLGYRDNSGRFKKGERFHNWNYHKIGEEVTYYGYTYIKIKDGESKGRFPGDNWILKQRYIWEKANNEKIKKGEIVVFKDGNSQNFDAQNLIKITRAENLMLNEARANGKGEITDTMLDIIRCKQMIKEI